MADELKIDEDIARGLPGGVIDYATHEAIEEALDRANAPLTDGDRFLTLVERIQALSAQRTEVLGALVELNDTGRAAWHHEVAKTNATIPFATALARAKAAIAKVST